MMLCTFSPFETLKLFKPKWNKKESFYECILDSNMAFISASAFSFLSKKVESLYTVQ